MNLLSNPSSRAGFSSAKASRALLLPLAAAAWAALAAPAQAQATLRLEPSAVLTSSNDNVTVNADRPTLLTGGINSDFQNAFDAWNATLSPGSQWTLQYGGTLSRSALIDVTGYTATAGGKNADGSTDPASGVLSGVAIQYTPGSEQDTTDPAVSQTVFVDPSTVKPNEGVWVQAVTSDVAQNADSQLITASHDNGDGTTTVLDSADAYTFSQGTLHPAPGYIGSPQSELVDGPQRDVNSFFRASSYLCRIDYANHVLTAYDGVQWGFSVVPFSNPYTGYPGDGYAVNFAPAPSRRASAAADSILGTQVFSFSAHR